MTLFIPLGVVVLSILVIGYIVVRKFVYLRKLSPEAINDSPMTISAFLAGFVPEALDYWKKINWPLYKSKVIGEFEKFLRRARIFFLKIESLIHGLSVRVRSSKKTPPAAPVSEENPEEEVPEVMINLDPKEEEQHLIIEIAKNPKDPLLYLRLGDIYLQTAEKENALASFQTVLQLDPENWYAKRKVKELQKPA